MLCTRPGGEVVAAFSDQLQREVRAEAVDRGDVLSEQREERRADIESQTVRLIGSLPTRRRQCDRCHDRDGCSVPSTRLRSGRRRQMPSRGRRRRGQVPARAQTDARRGSCR